MKYLRTLITRYIFTSTLTHRDMETGSANIKLKKVKDLVLGDMLEATKGLIIEAPFDQVRTPKGKTNIVVKYPSGNTRQYIWGKETKVRVA